MAKILPRGHPSRCFQSWDVAWLPLHEPNSPYVAPYPRRSHDEAGVHHGPWGDAQVNKNGAG